MDRLKRINRSRREALLSRWSRPPAKHNASANHKRMPSVDPVGSLDALIYSMANQLDITKLKYKEFESKGVLAEPAPSTTTSKEEEGGGGEGGGEALHSSHHEPCISMDGIFECEKCTLNRDTLVIT
jgi:hypothetical protein